MASLEAEEKRNSSRIDVTIVVCTFNRAELLRDALSSLAALTTGNRFRYEILVVDNQSTDATHETIQIVATRLASRLRNVVERTPGVAPARNRGVREARGEWIAFFDDDQIADEGWLDALFVAAEATGGRVILGARRLLVAEPELQRLPLLCRRILGELLESEQRFCYSGIIKGSTGNLLIHSSVFESVGLFDETTTGGGEDTDLFRRIKDARIPAWYEPSAVVYHVVPSYRLTDRYFRWTCRRHGIHVARRERMVWGKVGFPLAVLARVAQAVGYYVPRLVWTRFGGDATSLKTRCDLWRAEACLRTAARIMAPRVFRQTEFFRRLDFRSERQVFACAEQSNDEESSS